MNMMAGFDDIGAVILDIGSSTIRVGYAGEETPRHDIPTNVGIWADENGKHFNFGTLALHSHRADLEITTFLKEGMIEDWTMFQIVLEKIFTDFLKTDIQNHPILITEPAWILKHKREELTELMFETYQIPAIYLAKNAMLVGVSNSRSSCIVVDCGATHTSAIPVHDGYVIPKASVKTTSGGYYILEQVHNMLTEKKIEVVPYYRVASKDIVKADEPASYREKLVKRTTTWKNFMIHEVLQDFHSSVLAISDCPYDEDLVNVIPSVHYEFPNGYHTDFGPERFKVVESLFNLANKNGNTNQPSLDISSLVTTSIGMCEIDTRPLMYSNVVITGGNSNIPGFTERLTRDLQSKIPPSMRLKIFSQNTGTEKRFAAWVGGTILGSLTSFQQHWVSKDEYEEFGKNVVTTRL